MSQSSQARCQRRAPSTLRRSRHSPPRATRRRSPRLPSNKRKLNHLPQQIQNQPSRYRLHNSVTKARRQMKHSLATRWQVSDLIDNRHYYVSSRGRRSIIISFELFRFHHSWNRGRNMRRSGCDDSSRRRAIHDVQQGIEAGVKGGYSVRRTADGIANLRYHKLATGN